MSQSEEHKELVLLLAEKLGFRYPGIRPITDALLVPGDEVPPVIGAFRPDLYAEITPDNPVVIGEAKTETDLRNKHTYNQLSTFVTYLESRENGLFVLAVSGYVADQAKTYLRFICQAWNIKSTIMVIFDGFDFWQLDPVGTRLWHLYSENHPS